METDFLHYLIICPLVFLGGFVDAIAGGGGLISLPAYFLAGIPAHFALGTNKLSSLMGTAIATGRLWKAGCIEGKRALPAVMAALVGSSLGARLALLIPTQWFQFLLAVLLPVVAFFVVFRRTSVRTEEAPMSEKRRLVILTVSALVCGTYDGFYGPGCGTFMLLAFTLWAKLDVRRANGEVKVVNLASNTAAFVTFLLTGNVMWVLGLTAGVFGIAGNYLGAGLALKKGASVTRPIIVTVLVLLLIKTGLDFFT